MIKRNLPWNQFGTNIEKATSIEEAMRMAALDWEVVSNPIYNAQGMEIPNFKANTRTDDGSVLGIVGNRYKIVQNKTAFTFTEDLLGEGMQYEMAGVFHRGTAVWVLAKLPETKILDDKFDQHLVFINSHDGKGSVKVSSLPIRIVCSNALNVNLKKAQRTWAANHASNIGYRLEEAKATLKLANNYINNLAVEADRLANKKFSDTEFEALLDKIYPVETNDSDRKMRNIASIKEGMFTCLEAPDIKQYRGTAYGILNAVTDYVDHCEPNRKTSTFDEARWQSISTGHSIVDKVYAELSK